MKLATKTLIAIAALLTLTACEPEVGSEEWCQDIKDKGAGNVTANEAADFATHCVF